MLIFLLAEYPESEVADLGRDVRLVFKEVVKPSRVRWLMPSIPVLGRRGQEDGLEFKTSLLGLFSEFQRSLSYSENLSKKMGMGLW